MASISGFKVGDNGITIPTNLSFVGHKICGSGRFSNVYSSRMIEPEKREVAIKNVWSDNNESVAVPTTHYVEIQILTKLFHPALANLLYFYTRTSDNKIIHCLILDFLPTDMAKLRDGGIKFDTLDAKLFTFQLFTAIAYLASRQIVHMDIKPQNVIIDKDGGVLKLADFGNSRRLDTNESSGNPYQVTRFYRPPELLFGCEKFSASIDVWSTGCVAFEFFANKPLFKGKSTKDQINLLINVLGYPTDDDIKSMSVKRPRVGRKAARGIETFTSNCLDGIVYDLLNSVIVYNPTKRKTAQQILSHPIFDVFQKSTTKLQRSNGSIIGSLKKYLKMDHKRSEDRTKNSSGKLSNEDEEEDDDDDDDDVEEKEKKEKNS